MENTAEEEEKGEEKRRRVESWEDKKGGLVEGGQWEDKVNGLGTV